MPSKGVYVSETDLPIWEKAQTELGESVSSAILDCLRRRVAAAEARKAGMGKLTVTAETPTGRIIEKSFFGTWLISPDEEWAPDSDDFEPGEYWMGGGYLAVAETAKGNYAVYYYSRGQDGGELTVYPSLERLFADHNYPSLESRIRGELEDEIELDI